MSDRLTDTKNREFLYALFSRIFMKEADSNLLELIKSEGVKEFFPNLFEWEKYKKLSTDKLIESELNIDFTDISLLHLIPYETFYTRDDGMIESGGENRALQFYDRFDFIVEKDKARVLSPDHIGVELEFMYKLVEGERKALEDQDKQSANEFRDIEIEFLNSHILKWVPIYLINVINEASTPFYHDGARSALEFILGDNEYLWSHRN
jgi:TorA maturation chaperone TorD